MERGDMAGKQSPGERGAAASAADRPQGLAAPLLACLYALIAIVPAWLAAGAFGPQAGPWTRGGIAAGGAAAAMLMLQMVTSGRFERISGRIGIDVTMAFHKWAAPVALALAALHVLLLVGPPDPDHPQRQANHLWRALHDPAYLDARLAFLLLALLTLLALLRDRLPLRYETWRATHALGALALVALLLWHVIGDARAGMLPLVAYWAALAAAAVLPALAVHLRRLVGGPGRDWRLAASRKVADRLWEVTLEAPPGRAPAFRAGQFAWLSFGDRRVPFADHPFSIASPPSEAARPRFLVQEAGDFTRGIGSVAPGTRVGVDGPHGSFHLPAGGEAILLVAGGVGIAPILSILRDLAERGERRKLVFLYAARSRAALLPPAAWEGAIARLGARAIILADDADGSDPGVGRGPVTEAVLREALDGIDPARSVAMICGPGPMLTAVTDVLCRMGFSPERVEYERFQYGAGGLTRKDRRRIAGFAGIWGAILLSALAFALA